MFRQTFAQSLIATNSLQGPDENPTRHLLPPEPDEFRPITRRQMGQSYQYSEENSKRDYINITLGNSPQFLKGLEPQRQIQNISNFNKKMKNSHAKRYVQESTTAKNESRIIVGDSGVSKSKESFIRSHREDSSNPIKQVNHLRTVSDSRSYKDSRASRPGNSTVRQDSSFQSRVLKSIKQDSILKQSSRNNTRADKISPDRSPMMTKNQQLKIKVAELQNQNRTLAQQLQSTKQRLKSKQSENVLLKEKNLQHMKKAELHKENDVLRKGFENEASDLRKINEIFCDEIDKQKDQILRYEQKNEQSLKLLQKLNENITRREQKLHRELQQQGHAYHRLSFEKNQIQSELLRAKDTNKALENEVNKYKLMLQSVILERDDQSNQIKDINRKNNVHSCDLEREITEIKLKEQQLIDQLNQNKIMKLKIQKKLKQSQQQCDNIEAQLQNKLKQIEELNHLILTQKKKLKLNEQFNEDQQNKLIESFENVIKQLKLRVQNNDNQIEQLVYLNKEYEMNIQVLNEENQQNLIEIKDFKQEKKTLYEQKEEIKDDLKQLTSKNDKLYKDIEHSKQKEIQLNEQISQFQTQIIHLEERISQNITHIAERQFDLNKLRDKLTKQIEANDRICQEIAEKDKIIQSIDEKNKKFEKLLKIYKDELSRIKQNKEIQWQQMKTVYEDQIQSLQSKLRNLTDNQESKKFSRSPIGVQIHNESLFRQQESADFSRSQIVDSMRSCFKYQDSLQNIS